jgi:hypothetical protein
MLSPVRRVLSETRKRRCIGILPGWIQTDQPIVSQATSPIGRQFDVSKSLLSWLVGHLISEKVDYSHRLAI